MFVWVFFYSFVVQNEPNHNKDYSVVKTFGKPLSHKSGGIFFIQMFHEYHILKIDKSRIKHSRRGNSPFFVLAMICNHSVKQCV